MSQFFVESGASPPPGSAIVTLSAEGGAATPPDASNNFDFTGGGPDAGSSPFVITDTVSFGITAAGKMKSNAVFPHWQVIAASQIAAKSQGYLVNHVAGSITVTLPATPNVGDSFIISDIAGGGYVIAQNAGDSIRLGDDLTTTGVAGNLTTTMIGDTVNLVCWAIGPGASWVAIQPVGQFEVN